VGLVFLNVIVVMLLEAGGSFNKDVLVIGVAAAVCFVSTGVFGERALDWLKELSNWT